MADPTKPGQDVLVNVVKNGQSVAVPKAQLQDALSQGYHVETPTEKATFDYVEDNKGLGGTLKVAATQFADEFAGGIPEIVYSHAADPIEAAKWEALKKDHEYANTLGGIAGFGTSLFTPVGPVGLVAKAGGLAGRAAQKAAGGIAEAALEKALGKSVESAVGALGAETGKRAFARAIAQGAKTGLEKATGLGVEGLVNVAPSAFTEASFGDLQTAGEALAVAGGLGAGLGLVGAAASPVFKQINQILKKGEERAGSLAAAGESPKILEGTIAKDAIQEVPSTLTQSIDNIQNPETREFMKAALGAERVGAQEAKDLVKFKYGYQGEIPLPVLNGDKGFQTAYLTIAEKPTTIGQQLRTEIDGWKNFLGTNYKQALGEGITGSKTDVGEQIVQKLRQKADDLSSQFSQGYGEIESIASNVPASKNAFTQSVKDVLNQKEYSVIKNSDTQRFFKNLDYTINTLDDLKRVKSDLMSRARGMTLDPTTKRAIADVASNLEQQYDDAVYKFAANKFKTPVEREQFAQIISKRQELNRQYKDAMDILGDLGAKVGKKKVYGPQDFANAIEEMNATGLSDKLFSKNDPRFLQRLQSTNPEVAEIVLARKRQDILEKAANSADEIGAINRELLKLQPETVEMLVKDPSRLADFKKLYNSFNIAKPVNPSGSGVVGIYDRLLNDAQDRVLIETMKRQGTAAGNAALRATEQSLKFIGQAFDELPKALDAMLQTPGAEKVVGSAIGQAGRALADSESKSRRETHALNEEKIRQMIDNPTMLSNMVAKVTSPISTQGAPQIASNVNDTYVRAIQALNKYLPKNMQPDNPLLPNEKPKISDQQLHEYTKIANTILDPLSIIKDIGSGKVNKKQVDALKEVYPSIYNAMMTRTINHLSDKKNMPYQARLKASYLFGIPLSNSLNQTQFYQQTWKAVQPPQGGGRGGANLQLSTPALYTTDVQRRGGR